MKLFGNKPSGGKPSNHRAVNQTEKIQPEPPKPVLDANGNPIDPRRIRRPRKKPWYATGKGRGLVLLLAAVLLLSGVVWGGVSMITAPPERPTASTKEPVVETPTDENNPEKNPTKEPGKTTIPTVNKDTGEVEEIEWEAPGSYKEGFYNILVVGTDDDGTRTDTIMIARLNAVDHTVALMSMPRDTYISLNATVPKLNSVYGLNGKGEKGIEALRNQLKAILGFEVDYYVMVDMEAFEVTVDLVDGVEFNVPQRMYYTDPTQGLYIDFAPGVQWLDGADALNMIRFRGYASADIGRTGVQQDFLKALAKRCLDVANISKIPEFVEVFAKYVDTDLSTTDMMYFGAELLKCDFDNMYTVTPSGYATWHGDASCYSLYPGELCDIVNEYFNPYDQDIPLSSIHVRQGPVATMSKPVATKPAEEPEEDEILDVEEPEEGDVHSEEEAEDNGEGTDTEVPEDDGSADLETPDVTEPEPETVPEPTPETEQPSLEEGFLDADFGT